MSSKFAQDLRLPAWGLLLGIALMVMGFPGAALAESIPATSSALPPERALEVLALRGSEFSLLEGCPVDRVVAWACGHGCQRILAQVDECDPEGRWVLDVGDDEAHDESRGAFDSTDWLLLAARDLGSRSTNQPPGVQYEVQVTDPLRNTPLWAYVGCAPPGSQDMPPPPPRVRCEPHQDRVYMEHLVVGFTGAFPTWLSIDSGENLLDRFKVRARAKFFGVIPVRRQESSLQGRVLGWRIGPLRVIRAQQQWVQLGWGIRTPIFQSYAFFYPDFLDVPVVLRLRFPAAYFFSDIQIRAYVDFRDLRGWQLLLPGHGSPIAIDGRMTPEEAALGAQVPEWFALRGPQVTLVQFFGLSPSLRTVQRRFFYRDDIAVTDPPEAAPGEIPGVGYELVDWERVDRGVHSLHAMSFVLPPDASPELLIAAQRAPLVTGVRALPSR